MRPEYEDRPTLGCGYMDAQAGFACGKSVVISGLRCWWPNPQAGQSNALGNRHLNGSHQLSQTAHIATTNPDRAALFLGSPNETWREALTRFERFASEIIDEWHDEDSGETQNIRLLDRYDLEDLLLRHSPLPANSVLDLELMHGARFPEALVTLLTESGGFTLWPSAPCPSFEFYSSRDPVHANVKNLRAAMEFHGLHEFLRAEVSQEMLASIEQKFFCFATARFADAELGFLLFSREGAFMIYDFVDEDVSYSLQGIKALHEGLNGGARLDDVLRRSVNWSIYASLKAAEIPVDEYLDWRDNWQDVFPIGYGVDAAQAWMRRIPTVY